MAASVRIEDEAFSDGRYAELAEYAGLADADHARGKMAQLWRQCTLEKRYTVSAFLVRQYLGPAGVSAIVRARLGEQLADDTVRIRGTKGRIEWLEKLRKNGRKGGRPAKYQKKPSGYSGGSPSGYSELNPPAPAPAPAHTEDRVAAPDGALPALKAKADKPPREPRKNPYPPDWVPTDAHRAKALDLRIDIDREAEEFRSHHVARGNRFVNWDAAFTGWLSKAAKWRDERGGSRGAAQPEIRTNLQPL